MLTCYVSKELVGEKTKCWTSSRELGKFIKVVAGTTVFATAGEKMQQEFNKL
jgi:hypothetical protein